MTENWWNDYIGLPYVAKGRDRDGIDCWGLVRLVYAERFDIQLPSLADQYEADDRTREAELVAIGKEGWEKTERPRSGDVVLCRIEGEETHVGLMTQPGFFLHVRQGQSSVVERMDSGTWRHRIAGTYRYRENGSAITLAGCPHPLKTLRVEREIGQGLNLAQIAATVRGDANVQISEDAVIAVDGEYIAKDEWERYYPKPGSRIEYRATVSGSGVGRLLAMVAIMVVAWYAAPLIVSGMGMTAAAGFTAGQIGFATMAVSMGINMVGGLLLNAIFPVRPLSQPSMSAPKSMLTLQGGSNQPNHYGAVPVVLGRMRFTPPVGANTFVETSGTTSHLRMMLIWGYGPLQIYSLYIGATPLSRFEGVEVQTLDGDDTSEEVTRFNKLYGQDVTQIGVDVKLESDGTTHTWVQRSIEEEVDRIEVVLSFPQGLFRMPTEGKNAGKKDGAIVRGNIQIRQIGETSWAEAAETIRSDRIQLQGAWFNIDNDAELEPVYQWTRLSLDKNSNIVVREGAFTLNPTENPTGNLLKRLQDESFNADDRFDRLPAYGPEEEGLHDICMYGNAVYSTVDRRDGSITGCGLAISGRTATVASGSITRIENESFYVSKKTANAFTQKYSFSVPRGLYEIRVRRTNTSESNFTYSSGNKGQRYHDCILTSITGYAARRPLAFPKTLARTAIRIKATNQINGNVEGITGTATSVCKDWDRHTSTWVSRPTRNPASLFRYALQHPANAKPVPDSKIDLASLVDFHNYCRVEGFMFDMVITYQRSLMDVLRDICAAGRASPTMVDGKWSVIIDRPRSSYSQFFTPHNSWGFEGVRVMPKMPHGFRVQFNNAEKQFQPDEMIVYNDGYSAANATLFEGLTLPGVTTTAAVYKHARFHLAQIKLRPETYTLNVDMEHLVCTRGDLVKVTHDVPMWGLGTGRIKNRISNWTLELDEKVPMDAGVSYTIRIRLEDGSSITRTVAPATVDGYYSQITLTSSVTVTQGKPGNLFMFGSLNAESVDCIVQSVEPMDNLTARLTLVDYSPAVYDSDTEVIPPFNSQITKPPVLLLPTVTQRPSITGFKSDESVMSLTPGGDYLYAIRVSFNNPSGLSNLVTHVEGQIDWAEDTSDEWASVELVPVSYRSITFAGVDEGDAYRIRLRYVDKDGRAGPWTSVQTHTVAGRVNPPTRPDGLRLQVLPNGARRFTVDHADPPIDLRGYQIRYSAGAAALGWDQMTAAHKGVVPSTWETGGFLQGQYHFRVRSVDTLGKISTSDRLLSVTLKPPPNNVSRAQKSARGSAWA